MKRLALALLLSTVVCIAQVAAVPGRASAKPLAELTTAQIAKLVSPAVVVITGKTDSGDVLGSGFIISSDGKIVTNLHVIRDMTTASVQLANGDIFDLVSVLAVDERRDLAIIRVAGFNLPALEMGDSDAVTIGEPVVIVGSPRGLEGTVTAGILSSVRESGEGFRILQTDAAVNPGNSGGPLVNNKGQAVGVVSFKLRSSEGLNFAIPINYVRGMMSATHDPIPLTQMQRSLSNSGSDQSGPSLKETLAWLREKIPYGSIRYSILSLDEKWSVSLDSKAWSLDSCNATVGWEQTSIKPGKRIKDMHRYSLQLGSIETGSIESSNATANGGNLQPKDGEESLFGVRLRSRSKDIAYQTLSNRGQDDIPVAQSTNVQPEFGSTMTTSLVLFFNDEALANRILKAFTHAAELCHIREPF
jgi:hypothetical protein